jgi:predicted DNA-binding protein with PD1-like motif
LPIHSCQTIGGHLDNGCIIYTTAEIVIGATEEFRFLRTFDSEALLQAVEETGYQELEIELLNFKIINCIT